MATVGVHHPDLALGGRLEQRRGAAVKDDAPAVPGETVVLHRVVSLGDPALLAPRHTHLPEMPLLVVLFERVDVVLEPLLAALLVALGIGRQEVDGVSGRRPGDVGHPGGVVGQGSRLAGQVADQIDLGLTGVAGGDESDQAPVRRPARARLAARPVGELDRAGAVPLDPPDVAHPAIGGPIGGAPGVEQLGAVGGELRVPQRGNGDHVHQRHGTRRLGAGDGKPGGADRDREPPGGDGFAVHAHKVLDAGCDAR